jgi:exosortase A
MGREWPYAAGIIVACFGALCLIFREEVAGAYRVWMNSATYNHCFLIIPISLYMIWQRRNMLASVSPKPDFRVLLLIPLLSLAWFGASIFGVLEVRQFVAMTIAEMMFLGVLGWPVYRRLMAPLLYLYFLVPSGEFLVPALQDFTARFAVLGLELAGIPVFSDGTIIEVPVGTFAVAEACAGLRFLIAAIAFGVFYAMEIYESRIRRLIFIGLSVVVPIIANGFRAFGLIVAAEAFGSAASIEADHVTYGWVFFSMVLVALIFIGRAFSDRDWSWEEGAPRSLRALGRPDLRATALSGMLCVGLAAVGPAVGAVLDASPALVALKEAPPSLAAPWRRLAEGAADWRPRVVRADRQYSDSFTDGSIRVDRFVALYVPRGRENNLIRSDNRIADLDRWNIAARRRAVAHIGGREAPVNAAEIVSGTSRRLVWWFYVVEGTNAASVYEVKQHQVHAYLTRNGCPSAFVAVAVEMAEGRDAAGILDQYLGTMEPLGRYLCKE